ncbi:hypothetical protein [Mesoplasma melaleucae]|nr:hypothetical protein [Mesoplasma melaleucae]
MTLYNLKEDALSFEILTKLILTKTAKKELLKYEKAVKHYSINLDMVIH